jgi:hypothetical protein
MSRFSRAFRKATFWRATLRGASPRGADLWDVLSGITALAYILGFVAAVEAALGKLSY